MSTVDGKDVCIVCGEEYLYQFDCRTWEYTKISMCKCDRLLRDMEEFLKKRGLLREFRRFHREREQEWKQRK